MVKLRSSLAVNGERHLAVSDLHVRYPELRSSLAVDGERHGNVSGEATA